MYCPQCGTESISGQQYCRSCGANLKVIGKAVSLSEAIGRIPGPLPTMIKGMMKNLKGEQVSEDISRAMDEMNQEIVRNAGSFATVKHGHLDPRLEKLSRRKRKEKTAQQRKEQHVVQGLISLFSGVGLMIFLYYLSSSLILKLPDNIIARAPFDIPSVVHVIWLIGLIPTLTGVGRILAGLTIRPEPKPLVELSPPATETNELPRRYEPASVTERTTNILNRDR